MVRAQRRPARDESGFSLIELTLVVVILAVLLAIGIPTFLGARTNAQDRASQADLVQAVLTAKTYHTQNDTFDAGGQAATATAYQAAEPSLRFGVLANSSATTIGVAPSAHTALLVKASRSGKWECVAASDSGPTAYGKSSAAVNPFATAADCTGGW